MKNIISKGCLFFVLTILVVSCGSTKSPVVQNNTTTEKTIIETVHDTVFKIEADSSIYQALLDRNISIAPSILFNANFAKQNNFLRINCSFDFNDRIESALSHVVECIYNAINNNHLR